MRLKYTGNVGIARLYYSGRSEQIKIQYPFPDRYYIPVMQHMTISGPYEAAASPTPAHVMKVILKKARESDGWRDLTEDGERVYYPVASYYLERYE